MSYFPNFQIFVPHTKTRRHSLPSKNFIFWWPLRKNFRLFILLLFSKAFLRCILDYCHIVATIFRLSHVKFPSQTLHFVAPITKLYIRVKFQSTNKLYIFTPATRWTCVHLTQAAIRAMLELVNKTHNERVRQWKRDSQTGNAATT